VKERDVKAKNIRHPIKHFFILRPLQIRIIFEVILTVLLAAFLTTVIFTVMYNAKSREGSFYFMSNDITLDLQLRSILEVVLPPLITAEAIGIIIAFGIGLFSSRKVAVPLYKIEKWIARLKSGKLTSRLEFRHEDHMKELTEKCNETAGFYHSLFLQVRSINEELERNGANPAEVKRLASQLRRILDKLEL